MKTNTEEPQEIIVAGAVPGAAPVTNADSRPEPRRMGRRFSRTIAAGAVAVSILLPQASLSALTAVEPADDIEPSALSPDALEALDDILEPPTIDPYRPMTEEELAAQQAYDEATYPQYFHPSGMRMSLASTTPFWPGELMWFVGQTAAKAALSYGFELALDEVLPGMDPLQKVADQIEGLRGEIQGVSKQITDLGEQIAELKTTNEWDTYFNRERDVETHKATINLYAGLVAGYERYDEWDETNARTAVDRVANAMAQIEVKLVNGTDPAFQNLMRIQRYSLPDVRWEQIDRYRRSYESLLGTGLLNIMAAHQRFPGMFQSELDAAVSLYERTLEGLYAVGGAAYPQPVRFSPNGGAPTPIGGQLHALGTSVLVASGTRPLLKDEVKATTVSDFATFQSVFEPLRDDYERAAPDSKSFSSYLRSQGFQTSMKLADAVFVSENGKNDFRVYAETAGISGRNLQKGYYYQNKPYGTRAEAEAAAAQVRASALSNAAYTIEVETNSEGHAIASDVHAVDVAMNGVPLDRDFDPTVGNGDMGALRIANPLYDTLFFVDAVSGQLLGAHDMTQGPIDTVTIDAPGSGSLAVLLGDAVPGKDIQEGNIAPAGIAIVNTVEPNKHGELVFAPVSRSPELVRIRIQGDAPLSDVRIVRANMELVCGREKGGDCALEIDPLGGPIDLWAVASSYYSLQSWKGDCGVGSSGAKCRVDGLNGERTITATFQAWNPTEP